MQIQTKRVFFIKLDEDEAEDFLDDATDVQTRVREQLRGSANGNGTQTHTATLRAPMARAASPAPIKRGRPAKNSTPLPKSKRRSPPPVTCPECGETMDPRGLPGHRRRVHGSDMPVAAPSADGPSAE